MLYKFNALFGKKDDNPNDKGDSMPKNSSNESKINAKQYDEIHKENPYQASRTATHETKAYLKAEEKLKATTYAQDNYTIKEWVVKIRNCYPILSVLLGAVIAFVAGWLFVEGLHFAFQIVGLIAISVFSIAIISLLEVFKNKTAIAIFGKQKYGLIPLLALFFLLSTAISTGGGYLGSRYLNDKTGDITADYSQQTDSVRSQYQEMIAVYDDQIQSAQEALKKKNKWLKHSARQDLKEAQQAKNELLSKIKSESSELKVAKEAEIIQADNLNQYKAYIIVLIVILFELFYIGTFAYEYFVERGIKEENANHSFVTPAKSTVIPVNSVQPLNFEQQLLLQLIGNKPNALGLTYPMANQSQHTPQNGKRGVGFQFNKNASPDTKNADSNNSQAVNAKAMKANSDDRLAVNATKSDEVDYSKPVRKCKRCSKEFNYKHWNKQYCSTDCKDKAWEERNNAKLNFKRINNRKKGGKK